VELADKELRGSRDKVKNFPVHPKGLFGAVKKFSGATGGVS